MIRSNYTPATLVVSRCSVCRHPEREALDRDLVLRRRTQAEVALAVGVDRSTVSRHVKNHVRPALAEAVLLETTDVALGNMVEAFERLYAERWRLYQMAVASGDMKLPHANLIELRKLLETFVGFASKMKGANLHDVIGRDEAAEFRHMEQGRDDLVTKLEDLLGRHQRIRGDEHLNNEEAKEARSRGRLNYEPASDEAAPVLDDGSDASDAELTPQEPPASRSTPSSLQRGASPKKGMSPLTTPKKSEWDI